VAHDRITVSGGGPACDARGVWSGGSHAFYCPRADHHMPIFRRESHGAPRQRAESEEEHRGPHAPHMHTDQRTECFSIRTSFVTGPTAHELQLFALAPPHSTHYVEAGRTWLGRHHPTGWRTFHPWLLVVAWFTGIARARVHTIAKRVAVITRIRAMNGRHQLPCAPSSTPPHSSHVPGHAFCH